MAGNMDKKGACSFPCVRRGARSFCQAYEKLVQWTSFEPLRSGKANLHNL